MSATVTESVSRVSVESRRTQVTISTTENAMARLVEINCGGICGTFMASVSDATNICQETWENTPSFYTKSLVQKLWQRCVSCIKHLTNIPVRTWKKSWSG